VFGFFVHHQTENVHCRWVVQRHICIFSGLGGCCWSPQKVECSFRYEEKALSLSKKSLRQSQGSTARFRGEKISKKKKRGKSDRENMVSKYIALVHGVVAEQTELFKNYLLWKTTVINRTGNPLFRETLWTKLKLWEPIISLVGDFCNCLAEKCNCSPQRFQLTAPPSAFSSWVPGSGNW